MHKASVNAAAGIILVYSEDDGILIHTQYGKKRCLQQLLLLGPGVLIKFSFQMQDPSEDASSMLAWLKEVKHPPQDGVYPDPELTPGSVQETDYTVFCQPGWASRHRHVTESVREEVYSSYGLPGGDHTGYCSDSCELDHLISLELGGSNEPTNLWPESYTGEWNAHVKDKLENQLHKLVCCGAVGADVAANDISSDWIAAYNTYMSMSC
ncbi:hypothetical protein O6H91_Y477200 [Diphasiastrum complanatum]|nr:hypothetical protein O6H91_Y477200 [Diphasiastrum complanatum]